MACIRDEEIGQRGAKQSTSIFFHKKKNKHGKYVKVSYFSYLPQCLILKMNLFLDESLTNMPRGKRRQRSKNPLLLKGLEAEEEEEWEEDEADEGSRYNR